MIDGQTKTIFFRKQKKADTWTALRSKLAHATYLPCCSPPTTTAMTMEPSNPAASTAPTTVEVIAPSNLPAGYQFQVDAGNGQTYLVQVPAGPGVTAGERFAAVVLSNSTPKASGIPTGQWRDEWTNCCAYGWCHPQCCLSFWCATCAMGQIMTRLNLDWKADAFKTEADKPSLPWTTFKITFLITTAYHILTRIFSITNLWYLDMIISIAFVVYWTIIIGKTRKLVRETYNIPANDCGGEGAQDWLCALFCPCCTACHVARHLTDFDATKAECCTDTGLGPNAPPVPEFTIPAGNATPGPTPPAQSLKENADLETPVSDEEDPPPPPPTDDYDRAHEQTFVVDI